MCANIIAYLRFLLALCFINRLHRVISYKFSKPVCDWGEYYEPYVQIRESRSDMPILERRTAGHEDLRKYSGILCINGPEVSPISNINFHLPQNKSSHLVILGQILIENGLPTSLLKAFLHTKVEDRRTFIVDPAEIQIFENECLTFNMREQSDYENKDMEPLNERTKVAGLKVYWVTLFGDTDDYRKPAKEFYYHPHFGYVESETNRITGASFAFTVAPTGKLQNGPEPEKVDASCDPLKDENKCVPKTKPVKTLSDAPKTYCIENIQQKVKITLAPSLVVSEGDDTSFVCTVKEPYGEPDLSLYFPPNSNINNYKPYDCPPEDTKFVPTVKPLNISLKEDFRIISPSELSDEGTKGKKPKPGYPGYPLTNKSEFLPPTYGNFPYPGYYFHNEPNFNGGNKNKKDDDYKNIRYDVTECLEVPKPEDSCDGDDNGNACSYLHHVMTTLKTDWHSPLDDKGKPKSEVGEPAYEDRAKGAWRIKILNLIEEIFVRACPQVSPMLAPAVGRVIEFYLLESLKTPELKTKWTDENAQAKWGEGVRAIEDLVTCKDQITKETRLDFRRVRDLNLLNDIETVEKSLSGPGLSSTKFGKAQSFLTQKKYRFPFEVKLIKDNSVPHNIFYYKEAAEIDYDFNLAIDIHWKIFNTVIGYCNKFYTSRIPATNPNIFSLYDDDIFSFLKDKWLNADEKDTDNQVFNQLFGAFVNGAPSIYLDSCMEGAYIANDVQKMRQLRPVDLREGNEDDSGSGDQSSKTNFFTKMPPADYDSQYSAKSEDYNKK